ncbi:MAG: 30S ribosomal protein S6e [Ignisphaera sp.]|nr:30S ribosomal protein S6e [Ignisphaera sp.]MCX8167810.1 30S ribosomal protein S6e [Ignisphaera sp.]MDW8086078.1 30S ribosomal protein S6e [Ignisphaera sp.]
MSEFKLVISDPRVKNPQIVPVKVVSSDSLEYTDVHKEQRELPRIKLNPTLIKLLNPELGIVIVRIWKNRASREKVSLAAKVSEDASLDMQTVVVPAAFMRERLGASEAMGEVFRAPAFQIRIAGSASQNLVGLKIGDRIDGRIVGLPNIKLEVRGGSDLAGFPMRVDVAGSVKKYILLSQGPGYRPREDGERRRKLLRGSAVSEDIVQINTVVI